MMWQNEKKRKTLVILAGPTAVGKTELAIRLAQRLETDIISADSRQIYNELSLGTAKPTDVQLRTVKHHFINELSIEKKFTTADFERQAIKRLDNLFEQHSTVICAGGTGLYLKALVDGLDDVPDVPSEMVEELENEFRQHGITPLVIELSRLDPDYVAKADMSNPHRVLRALAVCRSTNTPFSSFLSGTAKSRAFQSIKICLTRDRTDLYDRINRRVDQMMDDGLEEEARMLVPFRHHQALQTVGYRELFDFFDGTQDRLRAIELIKQNSRRYAKRQMTWFRNQGKWEHFEAEKKGLMEQLLNLIS